ncbi:MAG: SGNH/GDSL hydrolase family protein [Lachnospiraceae bacterium]|nr:SGNH/GDSL hydrolase family protein [Lachnospiraceae bacterium]
MKKYGKKIAFIAILLALIYIPGTWMNAKFLTRNHLANGKNGIHAKLEVEPEDTIDILVLGDSESYTTVSPMQLWKQYGYTAYAAGQPGAKVSDTEAVLKTALKKQNPKVVLLETNVLFRYEPTDKKTQSLISDTIYQTFPLLKNHNAWKSPFTELRVKTYMGFPISAKIRPYSGEPYMVDSKETTRIDEQNQKTLRKIQTMCADKGAKLVLYSAPSPKNYNSTKHQLLVELAKAEGLEYIDLNTNTETLAIDWSIDTRDKGDHLNFSGAQKTTAYLGTYLKNSCEIPSRRQDECAKHWNRMLKVYEAHIQRAEVKLDENAKVYEM